MHCQSFDLPTPHISAEGLLTSLPTVPGVSGPALPAAAGSDALGDGSGWESEELLVINELALSKVSSASFSMRLINVAHVGIS